MDDKETFDKIKDSCLSEGIRILIEDIKKHKESSDTIKVMPIWNETTGSVLSSTSDEMLKRLGYINALEWVIGIVNFYQNNEYNRENDDIE